MTIEAATENIDYLQKFFAENPDGHLAGQVTVKQIAVFEHKDDFEFEDSISDVYVFRDIQYVSQLVSFGIYIPSSGQVISKPELRGNTLVAVLSRREDKYTVDLSKLVPQEPDIKHIVKILRSKEARITGKSGGSEFTSELIDGLQSKQNRLNLEFFERLFRPGSRPTHEELNAAQSVLEGYRSTYIKAPADAPRIGKRADFQDVPGSFLILDMFPMQNRMLVESKSGDLLIAKIDEIIKVHNP